MKAEFINYVAHLGNIRLSYSQDPSNNVLKIIEENHYYPFGLKHSGYNAEELMYARNSAGSLKIVPVPPLFLTSYNIKFQGQKREEELGLNWDSFKWRNYDYAIGRFMSIDPLAEEYTYNGTYNFSENRVIDGRELEGLEVILLNDTANNRPIIDVANNSIYNDNRETMTIHVFAHGNPNEFINEFESKESDNRKINSGEKLNDILNKYSELWRNSENKEGFTIILHSCRTGKTTIDKNGNLIQSVAEKISKSKYLKNTVIRAPNTRDFFDGKKELGPFNVKKTDKNGEYLPGTPTEERSKRTSKGSWIDYKNGKNNDYFTPKPLNDNKIK